LRANDHPDTRIKAADAKALHEAEKPGEGLEMLLRERSFQVLTCARLWPSLLWQTHTRSTDKDIHAMGAKFAEEFLCEAMKIAPGEVRERAGTVVFGIHEDGTAEVATYGVSRTDCHILGGWGSEFLNSLTACPFQTWFGWGNDGVPKPFTQAELDSLNVQQLAWVLTRSREPA
jgi:hypothetical protein